MTPKQIKALRKRLKLSQEGLARKLDVSTAAVQFWEQGKAKPCEPNKKKLAAIAIL